MPKCVVTSVTNLSEIENPPVILEYENATPPELPTNVERSIDCDNYNELTVQHNNMVYKGTVGEGYPTDLVRTYLGIRNKTTNEIRFIEVEQCRVKSTHHYEPVTEPDKIDAELSKKMILTKYGSQYALKKYNYQQNKAFNADLTRDEIEQASEKVDLNKLDTKIIGELGITRPPFNREADELDEIYDITKIIPKKVWKTLTKPAMEVMYMNPADFPFKTQFIIDTVLEVKKSALPISIGDLNTLKICVYLFGLVSLLNNKFEAYNRTEIPQLCKPFRQHLLQQFLQRGQNRFNIQIVKTNLTRRKTICYYTVLAFLTTFDFVLDFEKLFDGVNYSKPETIHLFKYINVRFKHKTKKKMIELKLPQRIVDKPVVKRTRSEVYYRIQAGESIFKKVVYHV